MAAILLFLAGNDLEGQEQSALSSFMQGQYATALVGFRNLIALEGDDPCIVIMPAGAW